MKFTLSALALTLILSACGGSQKGDPRPQTGLGNARTITFDSGNTYNIHESRVGLFKTHSAGNSAEGGSGNAAGGSGGSDNKGNKLDDRYARGDVSVAGYSLKDVTYALETDGRNHVDTFIHGQHTSLETINKQHPGVAVYRGSAFKQAYISGADNSSRLTDDTNLVKEGNVTPHIVMGSSVVRVNFQEKTVKGNLSFDVGRVSKQETKTEKAEDNQDDNAKSTTTESTVATIYHRYLLDGKISSNGKFGGKATFVESADKTNELGVSSVGNVTQSKTGRFEGGFFGTNADSLAGKVKVESDISNRNNHAVFGGERQR